MPPTPARIIYQNGLLSVESTNARLTDVLNGIRNKTGIQFEGMQPGQDRVAGKFGPAPADEILVSILRGSRFDYVIIGSPENPGVVQRVILTPSGSAGAVAAAPGVQPAPVNNGEDEESAEEIQGEPQEQVRNPQQPQPAVLPRQPANPAAPRTQEQMMEELKAMQQQQQNQDQNPEKQNPNPSIRPAPSRRPINPQ